MKQKTNWERVKDWICVNTYLIRPVWVDIPWGFLLYFFWLHFLSQGGNPLNQEYIFICWALLGIYWAVKESSIKRKRPSAHQRRPGGIYPIFWLASIIMMTWLISQYPENYMEYPPQMSWTIIIVVGGYFGINLIPPNRFSKVFTKSTGKVSL